MSATIGFDRPLQLDWLDLVASRLAETGDVVRARADARALVSTTVAGGDSPQNAAGKTMTVLNRIWLSVPEDAASVRDAAAAQLVQLGPVDRLAVHWAMCELAYPFYRDAASVTGRTLALSDTTTLSVVRGRLVESWGSRGTMAAAVQRILKMWDRWGVLRAVDGRGTYQSVPPQAITAHATKLIAEIRVRAESTHALDLDDLQRAPDLFPFVLADLASAIRGSEQVQLNREGGRRWVARAISV